MKAKEKYLQDYKSGMTRSEIAQKHRVCYQYVCRLLRKALKEEENNDGFYTHLKDVLDKNGVKETTINRLISWTKKNRIKTETELKKVYLDMYVTYTSSAKRVLFLNPEKYFGKISITGFGIKQYEALRTIIFKDKDIDNYSNLVSDFDKHVNKILNNINMIIKDLGYLYSPDVAEVVKATVNDLNKTSIKFHSVIPPQQKQPL